jgi:hypothetical protein
LYLFLSVNLPAIALVIQLLRFAHQRWPSEEQYQELKTELGVDPFRGTHLPEAGSTMSGPPDAHHPGDKNVVGATKTSAHVASRLSDGEQRQHGTLPVRMAV